MGKPGPQLRPASRRALLGAGLGALASRFAGAGLPALTAAGGAAVAAGEGRIRLVAFGDSLSAGFMLPPGAAFPVRLEVALRARGHDVEVANAGVSGDTVAAGLARLDWAVPEGTHGVIVELGANDALRGLDPAGTRAGLDTIVRRLRARGLEVLVAGMIAPRNLGADYARRFDPIFAEVAAAHGALHYPFFLDGVALKPQLNLADGIHPNERGVDVIVERILPTVEHLLQRIRTGEPK
jgi:acyl-CoA thioesterase-1